MKFFRASIALVVALVLLSGIVCAADMPSKTVLLTTHNLPPYGSFSYGQKPRAIADEAFRGIAVDRVRCVFEKLGVHLEIRVYPWKRAQSMVQDGEADGFFAASRHIQRDEFAVMSDVVADQKWNWYLRKENPLSPDDPLFKETATVGGFIGANMLSWMQENNYNITATPSNTEQLLKMLLAGRVDAVLANNHVMDALLLRYGVKDDVKVYLNQDKPLYVYFAKSFLTANPGFLDAFNTALGACFPDRYPENPGKGQRDKVWD